MSFDIDKLKEQVERLKQASCYDEAVDELKLIEMQMSDTGFWDNTEEAMKVQQKRAEYTTIIDNIEQLTAQLQDIEEFTAVLEEHDDSDLRSELETKHRQVRSLIDELEFKRMLGGEFDRLPAILSINSGAGGTEAQDWVEILLRMYLRWAESHAFSVEMIDALPGEEAGLKNVTLIVRGLYAYGYLSAEQGIHRLVRISPFDSNARRHTSFASVAVFPEIDDTIQVEINDDDLRIDTYRSSGAGGQHVNKTDSAVRITHIPTGVVVACQNERSQHKNKAQAMKVLKSRIYELEKREQDRKRAEMAGEKKEIGFGSQIRSYTLQPYQLIKDHRTLVETGKVQSVLDGDLDFFMKAYLLQSRTDA